MGSKLQDEIKQVKPFADVRQETWLNLQRTAALLTHSFEQKLRPYGLSPTQYNVLRILRGAGDAGLCQYEIGARLVAQVPDVPRILARMEKSGLVQRVRASEDRRMVMASLTGPGKALVGEMDEAVAAMMHGVFDAMSVAEMERLNELLVIARAPTRCGEQG